MSEKEHGRKDLEDALAAARDAAEPELDLSDILGLGSPLLVGVKDLHTVVTGRPEPKLVLKWDGDKALEVKRTDGGAVATLKVRF
jgi:hypothetical protein